MNQPQSTNAYSCFGFWRGRSVLIKDLLAGCTVGLVLIPQAMAYAALAGMPPISGIYAASFACIIGALFGRCAQLNTGPVAMTSLLTFAAIAPLAALGSDLYLGLGAILALLVGIIRIILGLCKGTFIVTFISQPVLLGFTSAAGLTIAATQIPKFFKINNHIENPILNTSDIFTHFNDAHIPSLAFGLGTLFMMLLFRIFLPRWPGLLIGLISATFLSWLIDFATMGGDIVGNLPAGLPAFMVPDLGWEFSAQLIGSAFLVVIIGLLEVMSVCSVVEKRLGTKADLDREMIGQGLSSITAGVTCGFPVSGSLSRSSLNTIAGAVTGFSSVVSGLLVLITLLFFTPLLAPLPQPALAATIVMAVIGLIQPKEMLQVFRIKISDGIAVLLTFFLTLFFAPNMIIGIGIGIGFSLALALFRTQRPQFSLRAAPAGVWVDLTAKTLPSTAENKILALQIRGSLLFTHTRSLKKQLDQYSTLIAPTQTLIIDLSQVMSVDFTTVTRLNDALQNHQDQGGKTTIICACPKQKNMFAHYSSFPGINFAAELSNADV